MVCVREEGGGERTEGGRGGGCPFSSQRRETEERHDVSAPDLKNTILPPSMTVGVKKEKLRNHLFTTQPVALLDEWFGLIFCTRSCRCTRCG